jgi:hypothetical protein
LIFVNGLLRHGEISVLIRCLRAPMIARAL